MPKASFRLPALTALLTLIGLAMLGCSQATAENPQTTVTSEPTATEEFIPIVPKNAEEIVILSIEEDGYAHLFAYIPEKMPLTRLTFGDWDDITPAASPDGETIAFSSNRGGFWDLYSLNLADGEVRQLTDTPEYEGAPTWSPDGSFLAYEAYLEDNLEILIGPSDDPLQDAMRLTDSPVPEHSPAWAPGGRQIAFVSNGDILLADLDRTDVERFRNLSNSAVSSESHPAWSPEGHRLAWASASQEIGLSGIYLWDSIQNVPAHWIGEGDWPAWDTSGSRIVTTFNSPNDTFLTTYSTEGKILQPLTPFPATLRGLTWANLVMPNPLPREFEQASEMTPAALWAANGAPVSEGAFGRWSLVNLPDVQAPYPQMHDLADEAFAALRERVQREAGWDALASLENAFVPITVTLDPGFGEDWLYTGRAFAINSLMTNAGWMAAVREDFGARTYWRLYLRAQLQDGSLGEPLRNPPWDLSARYNLDPMDYEEGGKYGEVPPGYWVDVTSLAAQYGWERVPALPNWRTYYRGARFTEFALTDGLDWYTAMLQLYPPDVLVTPTRLLPPTPTASITPTFTPTRTPTRTPRATLTASLTPLPSSTPTPSQTPTSSVTPPTIVP